LEELLKSLKQRHLTASSGLAIVEKVSAIPEHLALMRLYEFSETP